MGVRVCFLARGESDDRPADAGADPRSVGTAGPLLAVGVARSLPRRMPCPLPRHPASLRRRPNGADGCSPPLDPPKRRATKGATSPRSVSGSVSVARAVHIGSGRLGCGRGDSSSNGATRYLWPFLRARRDGYLPPWDRVGPALQEDIVPAARPQASSVAPVPICSEHLEDMAAGTQALSSRAGCRDAPPVASGASYERSSRPDGWTHPLASRRRPASLATRPHSPPLNIHLVRGPPPASTRG